VQILNTWCACMCACVCTCMCVRERQRERVCEWVTGWLGYTKSIFMFVLVFLHFFNLLFFCKDQQITCLYIVWVSESVNQWVCVHMWMCVCILGVWGGEKWLMQCSFFLFYVNIFHILHFFWNNKSFDRSLSCVCMSVYSYMYSCACLCLLSSVLHW